MSLPPSAYRVVRTLEGPGRTDVALVRLLAPPERHRLGRHHGPPDAVVLHRRAFRPLLELAELEAYAGQLASAAEHGNRGTLWYFVTTTAHPNGRVEVSLYDRWFDGQKLRCERRAHGEFDAGAQTSVVPSVEFAAGLEVWAEERNREREEALRAAVDRGRAQTRQAVETEAAAAELAEILARVRRGA